MKTFYLLLVVVLTCLTASAQITLVKQFNSCCGVNQFEPLGSFFMFNAEGSLWRSDGTTTGTMLVRSGVAFPNDASLRGRVGSTIFFWVGGDLWKTDGTQTGTVLVKSLNGTIYGPLVNVNGLLVFGIDASATGRELWRSDGTEAGTYMITDLLPGTGSGYAYTSPTTAVFDNYFYFPGPPTPTGIPGISRSALYRTDGTAAGTTQVTNGGFEPYGMIVHNGQLIYRAAQTTSIICQGTGYVDYTHVLMKVGNGVASILKRPADVRLNGNANCPITSIGDTFNNTSTFVYSDIYLYFKAQTEQGIYNIWRTDGTTNGTIQLTNFSSDGTEGPIRDARFMWDTYAQSNFNFSNLVYFPIKTNAAGIELWRSDGTANGTYLLKDINPSTNTDPKVSRTVNGITYFFANNGTNGAELWKTDGSNSGTQMVQDLNPGANGQTGSEGIGFGQGFCFYGDNGTVPGLYTTCTSPAPTITATPSTTVCALASTTLTASGCAGTVTWSTGASGSTLVLMPSVSTVYSASCSQTGCASSGAGTIELTVNPLPDITVNTAILCSGQPISFTATGFPANAILQWQRNGTSIAGATSAIYSTTQAGEYRFSTLVSSATPKPSGITNTINDIFFLTAQTGWAVSDYTYTTGGKLLTTTDGGNTWIPLLSVEDVSFKRVYFADTQVGWALTYHGLVKTTNGGTNWTTVFGSYDYTFYDMASTDSQHIWMVGYDGVIIYSINGGNSWLGIQIPGKTLTGVYFKDALNGWAVGLNGYIIKTTDGGNNWVGPTSGTTASLNSIYFTDLQTGWAVGDNGTILKSTNGGNSWVIQSSGSTRTLNGVQFVNSQIGWVVGNSGTLLRTDDGGSTWASQSSGVANSLLSVHLVDGQNGWLAGNSGTILKFNPTISYLPLCISASKTVNLPPAVPIITESAGSNLCLGQPTVLSVTNCTGTLAWLPSGSGNSIAISPTSSTTYTATCTKNNCTSSNIIAINVKPIPIAPAIRAVSCSTNGIVKRWDKRFGGVDSDVLNTQIATADGGYLLGGQSASSQTGDRSQPTQGSLDYWVVKIDANGTKLWDKRFGGADADVLYNLLATTDGGYLLGGYSNSGQTSDKSQPTRGGYDYWVVKIDGSGTKLWDKRFGGAENDFLTSQVNTSDGGYLLGGYSFSDQTGDKSQTTQGDRDYWVVKIDANGTKLWDKRFGGNLTDALNSLIKTSDGGYLLGGQSASGQGGDRSQPSQGSVDYWVVKIDGSGTKLWDKRFGGSDFDYLLSMVATPDGGYLLGGQSNSGQSGDRSQPSQGSTDYWVVKIDGSGTKLWDKRFGGSANDDLTSVVAMANGGYLLGGYSGSGLSGNRSQGSQGGQDNWLVQIDESGNQLWDKRFGGAGDDYLVSLVTTLDSGYLLGNFSTSGQGGDKSQSSQGSNDYWVVNVAECIEVTGAVCVGTPVTLQASGCAGIVTWSTGAIGASVIVTPQQSTTYTAICMVNGCVSPASTVLAITVNNDMVTLKAGSWSDPTIWSCNRVPTAADLLTLKHAVTIPANYQGNALRLLYTTPGQLIYRTGGRLRVGQ